MAFETAPSRFTFHISHFTFHKMDKQTILYQKNATFATMKNKKYSIYNVLILSVFVTFVGLQNVCFSAVTFPVSSLFNENNSEIMQIATHFDNLNSEQENIKIKKRGAPQTKKGKVTFETFDKSYEKAMKHYKQQQYLSAARLFEELYPLALGTPAADTILFAFADCYFQNQDYQLAAFHYKDYARRYPNTPRAEEAHYRCLQAIYNVSPYYSLDQFETRYAIEEINLFVRQYPYSQFMESCNSMLDELRDKLAKKDFEIIKLYHNTEKYEAAQIATKNFLKDFPESKFVPEVLYILVQNNLKYAKKSVVTKKRERFLDCVAAFDMLTFKFPDSHFKELAKPYSDEAKKNLDKKRF